MGLSLIRVASSDPALMEDVFGVCCNNSRGDASFVTQIIEMDHRIDEFGPGEVGEIAWI